LERGSGKWKYWGGRWFEKTRRDALQETRSVGKEQRGEKEEGEVMFGKGSVCEWITSSEVACGSLRGFPFRLLFLFLHCECWMKLKCSLIPVSFV
jgi:hypothetical protein